MMPRMSEKTPSPSIDSVCQRLERMQRHGYFDQPRNLSNVSCRLADDGYFADLATLGCALSRMKEEGALSRTVPRDGLLYYVETKDASK